GDGASGSARSKPRDVTPVDCRRASRTPRRFHTAAVDAGPKAARMAASRWASASGWSSAGIRSGSTGSFMAPGPRNSSALVPGSAPGPFSRTIFRTVGRNSPGPPRSESAVAGQDLPSLEQREELRARAVDLLGRSGMVERDHLPQRRVELLAGPSILVVEQRGIQAPEPGDLPDRHPLVESE